MTEDEFRQEMKEHGWDEKTIDEILEDYHEDQKKGRALPLEKFWPIVPKPYMETFRPASVERKKLQTEE